MSIHKVWACDKCGLTIKHVSTTPYPNDFFKCTIGMFKLDLCGSCGDKLLGECRSNEHQDK